MNTEHMTHWNKMDFIHKSVKPQKFNRTGTNGMKDAQNCGVEEESLPVMNKKLLGVNKHNLET